MSKRWSDATGMLRGLQLVGRASANHQQKELGRIWKNSSVKEGLEKVGVRTEEKFSECLTKPDKLVGILLECVLQQI